jgi:hypothetical protein
VYESLFGFEGMEFYFKAWDELVGMAWADVIFAFPDACPIGIRRAATPGDYGVDTAGGFTILLNPALEEEIREGDEVLVVAEDDNTYAPQLPIELAATERRAPPSFEEEAKTKEAVFICGWRRGDEAHTYTHTYVMAVLLSFML